jgi:hypothetical protein
LNIEDRMRAAARDEAARLAQQKIEDEEQQRLSRFNDEERARAAAERARYVARLGPILARFRQVMPPPETNVYFFRSAGRHSTEEVRPAWCIGSTVSAEPQDRGSGLWMTRDGRLWTTAGGGSSAHPYELDGANESLTDYQRSLSAACVDTIPEFLARLVRRAGIATAELYRRTS